MGRLMEAHVEESFDAITSDLHRLYWASLAMELTAELVGEQTGASAIFSTAVRFLTWLSHEEREAWFIEDTIIRNNIGGSWHILPGISMHDDTNQEIINSTIQ